MREQRPTLRRSWQELVSSPPNDHRRPPSLPASRLQKFHHRVPPSGKNKSLTVPDPPAAPEHEPSQLNLLLSHALLLLIIDSLFHFPASRRLPARLVLVDIPSLQYRTQHCVNHFTSKLSLLCFTSIPARPSLPSSATVIHFPPSVPLQRYCWLLTARDFIVRVCTRALSLSLKSVHSFLHASVVSNQASTTYLTCCGTSRLR